MKSVSLQESGVARISIAMATLDGASMSKLRFLIDTGATRTTIPKYKLVNELGYTDAFMQESKKILPEHEKPLMANGKRADVYQIIAPRINIDGHELQPGYILTSDTIANLNLLLGLDILSYFKFTYDFDAIDDDAPHGRMFYEFRESRIAPFTKLGEHFAYKLDESGVS